ncbi:MAG TPA: carboxylating nicotinate-nucleotide diphosphorylase, partial [Actinomycetota bacterium]|nr:carboxylating nicotinate-nucleotide diphosphorylase [Actinomycetota bacterium]
GDITTQAVIPPGRHGSAQIELRQPAVLAGLPVARECFALLSADVQWDTDYRDGQHAAPGPIARVTGPLRALLTAERTALNLLGRLSGIGTLTAQYVAAVADTPVRIIDTRKTTPGLRVLEKYAVRVGGGFNHRFGLDDGVLIKDNHIAVAAGVTEALGRARESLPHGLRVQVEVASLEELDEALAAGADAVLLDNMTPEMARAAVARAGGKVFLEASGGITLDNVREYAATGVDFISIGALTHSAPAIDFSMEVNK